MAWQRRPSINLRGNRFSFDIKIQEKAFQKENQA